MKEDRERILRGCESHFGAGKKVKVHWIRDIPGVLFVDDQMVSSVFGKYAYFVTEEGALLRLEYKEDPWSPDSVTDMTKVFLQLMEE